MVISSDLLRDIYIALPPPLLTIVLLPNLDRPQCAQDEARLAFANRTRCRQVPSLFRTFFETFAERARQSHLEEGRSWKAARQSTVNNLLRQRLPDDPVRAVAYVSAALLLAAIPAGPSPEYRWPTLSAADKLTEAKEKAYTSRSGSDVGTSCTSIFFAAGIDQSDAPPPASSMVQPLVLGASVPGFTTTPTDTPSLLTIGPAPGMAREMKGRGVDEQSLGLDTYTQDYFAPFSDHEAAASAASSILPEATWASLAKPCLTQPLATGTENHMSEQERWHKLRLEDTASRRNDVEWFPAQFSQGMPASAEPATATPNAAGTSQSTVQTAAAADISSAGLHRPCSFNGHVATTSGLGTTPLCGVRKGGPCLDVYSTRKCREATLFMATATATPAVTVVRSEGPVAGAEMEPEVTIPPLVRPPSLYGSGSCLDPWTVVDSPRSTDTDGCDDRGGDIFGITCDHDFDDVVRCRYHLAPSKKARWE